LFSQPDGSLPHFKRFTKEYFLFISLFSKYFMSVYPWFQEKGCSLTAFQAKFDSFGSLSLLVLPTPPQELTEHHGDSRIPRVGRPKRARLSLTSAEY